MKALIDKYKWAIDIEICVMPQEGLTNNPGTDELMVAALKNGAKVVGAAPSYDSDSSAQIRRVFEMAREFDVDIDMHVDSGATAEHLDTLLVCDLAEKYKWGGRVAVGHVGKLATMPFKDLDKVARRMADAGVAATVLTATDLYLGGRHTDHNVPRNVVDLNFLTERGVTCSVGSNNILNPFTPFGDGQLLRQVNMHAHRHPARQRRRGEGAVGHDHVVGREADAQGRLRHRRRQSRRPGGARRARCDHRAAHRRARAGRLQARPAHRDARARAPAQAVIDKTERK